MKERDIIYIYSSLTKLCLQGFLLYDLKNRAMVSAPGGSPMTRSRAHPGNAKQKQSTKQSKAKLSKVEQS